MIIGKQCPAIHGKPFSFVSNLAFFEEIDARVTIRAITVENIKRVCGAEFWNQYHDSNGSAIISSGPPQTGF